MLEWLVVKRGDTPLYPVQINPGKRATSTETLRNAFYRDLDKMNEGRGPDEMQRRYLQRLEREGLASAQA